MLSPLNQSAGNSLYTSAEYFLPETKIPITIKVVLFDCGSLIIAGYWLRKYGRIEIFAKISSLDCQDYENSPRNNFYNLNPIMSLLLNNIHCSL